MDLAEILPRVGMVLIPFLFALCVHEYAHGWVAEKLGDPTAKLMGRLTLNPFAHADLVGTILLPVLAITTGVPFFGWAKPVPVNDRYFKNRKMGMFWVALAGPGSNLLMAFGATFIFALTVRFYDSAPLAKGIVEFAKSFLMINLSLAYFNLLPIHPLDGGKIFAIFFTDKMNRKLEELAPMFGILLILLFMSGGLARVLFQPVMMTAQMLLRVSLALVGIN